MSNCTSPSFLLPPQSESINSEDEDDEESLEWEREQIRRATAQLELKDSGKPKLEYKPSPSKSFFLQCTHIC